MPRSARRPSSRARPPSPTAPQWDPAASSRTPRSARTRSCCTPSAARRRSARGRPSDRSGTYVELKKAVVGPGAKVPHLAYVGDASIGTGANIGAGTIFANYDGVAKNHTDVGEHAFVGSNTVLVAPVAVGDGAYTAAGSVVAEDVPPG